MMVEALKDWPLVQSPAEEKYLLVKKEEKWDWRESKIKEETRKALNWPF